MPFSGSRKKDDAPLLPFGTLPSALRGCVVCPVKDVSYSGSSDSSLPIGEQGGDVADDEDRLREQQYISILLMSGGAKESYAIGGNERCSCAGKT
jgi:hypothetical protein